MLQSYLIIVVLSVIGGLVLLIACIHFLRASRRVIAFQFLSESLVLTFCVLLLGLLLAQLVLPGFRLLLLLGLGFVTGWLPTLSGRQGRRRPGVDRSIKR